MINQTDNTRDILTKIAHDVIDRYLMEQTTLNSTIEDIPPSPQRTELEHIMLIPALVFDKQINNVFGCILTDKSIVDAISTTSNKVIPLSNIIRMISH